MSGSNLFGEIRRFARTSGAVGGIAARVAGERVFGIKTDRAAHAVRLIQFRVGTRLYRYVTNVRDPQQLSAVEVAKLYARRWDFELAIKLVKRELGLHLVWSVKPVVIAQQLWAALCIAQILHAVRELIELGLLEKLDASGVRTRELAYFSKHGKPIWSEPRGIEAGYKWPQFSIHRGTLQQILLDAATERLGAENILTSHHLSGWTATSNGIRADFIDKATGKSAGSHDGALLIAADGNVELVMPDRRRLNGNTFSFDLRNNRLLLAGNVRIATARNASGVTTP